MSAIVDKERRISALEKRYRKRVILSRAPPMLSRVSIMEILTASVRKRDGGRALGDVC